MAKITYLGEGIHPPQQIEWEGIAFPLGQAVDVDDPAMIRSASCNPHFKVEDDPPPPKPEPAPAPPPPAPEPDDEDDDDDEEEKKPARHTTRAAHHAPARKKR